MRDEQGQRQRYPTTITPSQKTIVDRCITKCYEKYLAHDFNKKYIPTLADLQELLDEEGKASDEAYQLAEGMAYYTKGNMNMFSHKSNIDYENRMVVFNVRDLGNQLKQIALLIVLDFIWNRMTKNSDNRLKTYCYIDEIHVLFKSDFSAGFIEQLYKRGRKYGLIATGITQDVQDLLKSQRAINTINNSEFLLMLDQAEQNLKVLASMLGMSENQMSFVMGAEAGSGLLRAGKIIVPFVDHFPKDSYLYMLMSTKFGEEDISMKPKDLLQAGKE